VPLAKIGPVVQTQRLVILLSWNLSDRQVVQTVAEVQVAHPGGQTPHELDPAILN
jgi:hypothetical protein